MRAIRVNDSNGHIVAGGFGRVDNGIVKHEENPKLYDFLSKHANDADFPAVNFASDSEVKTVLAEIAAKERATADAKKQAPPAATRDKKDGD